MLLTSISNVFATEGYVAFDGRLQRWSYSSATGYSLVGNPVDAVTAGLVADSTENHRVLELKVNPNTGDIYTQGSDNLIRRWRHDGTDFIELGQRNNSGGRGFAFADDNSIYALNGPGFLPALDPTGFITPSTTDDAPVPLGGGVHSLLKFSPDLTTEASYSIGVNGNDLVHAGNGDIYVVANDGDGQIYHFKDTGSSFTNVSAGAPMWAGTIALNSQNGKYAAAHGLNKSTGFHIPRQNQFPPEEGGDNGTSSGPAWMITGSLSDVDAGTWDAGNTGTGIDYVNDMEIGPDGTIFANFGPNIGSTSTWIMAWEDRGPAQIPNLVSGVGNSDSRGAWLAVDKDSVIHTATNDGGSIALRAWTWDPQGGFTTALAFATQLGIPGAEEMEEIAIIQPPSLSADFNDDLKVDAADLNIWSGTFGGAATGATGDANGDGRADGLDFLTWQRQFGSGGGAPINPVPEPTGAGGCLVFAWMLLRRNQPVAR